MYFGFKIEGKINKTKQNSPNIYVTFDSESFDEYLDRKFNISEAIERYEIEIKAIDKYYQDHNQYPIDLDALVPDYLDKAPGIYIKHGNKLYYSITEHTLFEGLPFSFKINGNYPGLAFIHGWSLYYCPIEVDGCNVDYEGVNRIDDNWIWIHSSAL
jgi:hypothetical protein